MVSPFGFRIGELGSNFIGNVGFAPYPPSETFFGNGSNFSRK